MKLTIQHFHDDDSFSVLLCGVWLSHADERDEAVADARFVISAYRNGAGWARAEFPELARVLFD